MRVGIATAKAMATLRVPVIPMTSLDLLALPLRFTDRLIAAVIDARRGEVYHASYRQVPGGVQRLEGPAVGPVDDLVADLLATGEGALLVGDGALRPGSICAGVRRAEFVEQWLAHPSAAPLVQLAHAKALREEWVQPAEVQPVPAPARCGDQLGHPGVGAVEILPEKTGPIRRAGRGGHRPDQPPCGAATSAASSRSGSCTRGPGRRACSPARSSRCPERGAAAAHVGRRLVGYGGGLLVAPDSRRITNVAVDPSFRRQGVATGSCWPSPVTPSIVARRL